MRPVQKIKTKFEEYSTRSDDLKIEGWAFKFKDGSAINVQIDKNEIGGPYGTPSADEIFEGEVYIRWADGRVSKAKLDAPALNKLDAALANWRAKSYVDQFAPEILDPQDVPELSLSKPDIADIVMNDCSPLFDALKFFSNGFENNELAKILDAGLGAELFYANVMNSKGLSVGWEETDLMTQVVINGKYWDLFHERMVPAREDLEKQVQEINRYLAHSNNFIEIDSGNLPVVFIPTTLDSFMEKFVLESLLGGEIVANNKSLYRIEDFKAQRKIFHERINLKIDAFDEYSGSTMPCSAEGVPAKEQYLIEKGKLITPLLDLKYAGKTGMPPTSPGLRRLQVDGLVPYSDMIRSIDKGIIVYTAMGMHSQSDAKQGNYNLPVGTGFVVEKGEVVGSIAGGVLIAGNMFDALRDEKTIFAEYSSKRNKPKVAMLTEASVTSAK